ncbi:MAG: hypothetical protein F4X40_05435 [Chloroflexi bacterium]|nr:hypothetical protein [Chloroflexota bacterium]
MAVIAFPASAFQAAVANGAGRLNAEGASAHLGSFALRAAIVGGAPMVAVAALIFIYREAVGQFFGFDGNAVVLWICASLVTAMWLAAHRGTLQGSGQFTALGILTLFEIALRLIASVSLVLGGFGVDGATAGFPAGVGGALVYGVWSLRHRFGRHSNVHVNVWPTVIYESRAVPAMLSVFGAQSTDIVIANTRLLGAELEAYSAAALAGRIVFYAGFVVSLIVHPRYRHAFSVQRLQRRFVAVSFGTVALICASGIAVGLLIPHVLHSILVGSDYTADPQLMQVYLAASSMLTCALFLTTIAVAAGWSRVALALTPIAIIQVTGYALIATTGMDFARILTAAAVLMFIVLSGSVMMLLWKTARRAHPSPG